MTADTVPLVQFWTYLGFYGLGQPVVGLWLKIAAGICTALPLLLFAMRVARKGWPGTGTGELHGETRWASRSELARAGFYAKFGGLFVGRDKGGRYLRFGGPEHVACYAPTRSGKGVGLVIPNCLLYEASLVCLDVKKENWAATAGIRTAVGQKVFLFDPLAPDGRTARYNPFSYVRRGTIDSFERHPAHRPDDLSARLGGTAVLDRQRALGLRRRGVLSRRDARPAVDHRRGPAPAVGRRWRAIHAGAHRGAAAARRALHRGDGESPGGLPQGQRRSGQRHPEDRHRPALPVVQPQDRRGHRRQRFRSPRPAPVPARHLHRRNAGQHRPAAPPAGPVLPAARGPDRPHAAAA